MGALKGSKIWPNLVLVSSIGCLLAVLIAVFGVRNDLFGFRTAAGILTHTVEVGIGVLVATIVVFIIYAASRKKMIISLLIVLLPVIGIIASQPKPTPGAIEGQRPAPLNDISTDTANPPLYSAVAAIRPVNSNTLIYPEKAATLQAQRFPSITPIYSTLSTDDAFKTAMIIVENNGWSLAFDSREAGIIEAVESSLVFNFQDDIVIRITPNDSGSIVDIRSHSRVGLYDMNANGNRVMAFIDDFTKRSAN